MKKQKIVYQTEETQELKKFFMVLVIVVLIIVAAFALSSIFLKETAEDLTYQTGSVSTNIAIVGTILNNPESEYYVLAYDTESKDASAYVTYASYYTNNAKDPIMIYYLDLSSTFNKPYYVKEGSNPKAKTVKDLKMLNGTLLHIKNGKITEYIEGIDKIAEALKVE